MTSQKTGSKKISGRGFDRRFEHGGNITDFLDIENALVVRRVNVDFPEWMIQMLDREASRLNVSRQAVIKMWIGEKLKIFKKAA